MIAIYAPPPYPLPYLASCLSFILAYTYNYQSIYHEAAFFLFSDSDSFFFCPVLITFLMTGSILISNVPDPSRQADSKPQAGS